MKKIFYILLANAVILGSCSKKIGLTPGFEEFDVIPQATTYKVGETVQFDIQGNPDLITFYSGELYHQYEYREARKITIEDIALSFSTANPPLPALGPPGYPLPAPGSEYPPQDPQTDQFAVLVSTDFNGNYSSFDNVAQASWIDITSRFTLSPGTSTSAYTTSGESQLSDLIVPGKPLYIAFKYVTEEIGWKDVQIEIEEDGVPKPVTVTVPKHPTRPWWVNNFNFTGSSVFDTHILGDMITSNFILIEQKPDVPSLSTMAQSRITLTGYPHETPADPDPGTETWVISKGFDPQNLDNGRDRPIAIKGNEDSRLKTYGYRYSKPGVYKVYFVAANTNVDGSKQAVKEIEITIVEDDAP